jgi:protein-L-isoaspartate O-methyltransferase
MRKTIVTIFDSSADAYSNELPEALLQQIKKGGLTFATLGPDDAYFVTHRKGGWHGGLPPKYRQSLEKLKSHLGDTKFDRSIRGVGIIFLCLLVHP